MFVAVKLEQAEGSKGYLTDEEYQTKRTEAEMEYAALVLTDTQATIAADVLRALTHQKGVKSHRRAIPCKDGEGRSSWHWYRFT